MWAREEGEKHLHCAVKPTWVLIDCGSAGEELCVFEQNTYLSKFQFLRLPSARNNGTHSYIKGDVRMKVTTWTHWHATGVPPVPVPSPPLWEFPISHLSSNSTVNNIFWALACRRWWLTWLTVSACVWLGVFARSHRNTRALSWNSWLCFCPYWLSHCSVSLRKDPEQAAHLINTKGCEFFSSTELCMTLSDNNCFNIGLGNSNKLV